MTDPNIPSDESLKQRLAVLITAAVQADVEIGPMPPEITDAWLTEKESLLASLTDGEPTDRGLNEPLEALQADESEEEDLDDSADWNKKTGRSRQRLGLVAVLLAFGVAAIAAFHSYSADHPRYWDRDDVLTYLNDELDYSAKKASVPEELQIFYGAGETSWGGAMVAQYAGQSRSENGAAVCHVEAKHSQGIDCVEARFVCKDESLVAVSDRTTQAGDCCSDLDAVRKAFRALEGARIESDAVYDSEDSEIVEEAKANILTQAKSVDQEALSTACLDFFWGEYIIPNDLDRLMYKKRNTERREKSGTKGDKYGAATATSIPQAGKQDAKMERARGSK